MQNVVKLNWQPLTFTVSLHLIILVLMLGWQMSVSLKEHQPDYVKARLVQLTSQLALKKPEPVEIPLPSRIEPKVDPQEDKRKQQEQLKQAQLKKEQLKKERLKKEQDKKAATEKLAKEKAEKDKLAKEKAAQEKTKQEQILKEQAAAEKRRAEEALAKALAQEQSQQQQLADVELAQAYAALIKQRVEQNWSRPPSAQKGMEAVLEIQLVPTGYVSGVTLIKSSGNIAFDLSAEQAVQKVDRFTEIKDMPSRVFESQFRRFTLKFRPDDKL